MALFFTRRSYNAQSKKFTHNPAQVTRYVKIDTGPDAKGRWTGGTISRADWLDQVAAESGPDHEVMIFVHGFNNTQSTVLKRLAKMQAGLKRHGYKGAVIAYDWPSEGMVWSYDNDKRDAKLTAPFLVQDGILPLLAHRSRLKVHLLAHSMGAYLTLRALADVDDAALGDQGGWRLGQVMFVSADVEARALGRGAWGSLLLAHRCERFTNYFSGLDDTLNLPSVIANALAARAGRVGMPKLVEKSHVDLFCNEQYLKDVPRSKRSTAYSHAWWFDNDAVMCDMALTMSGAGSQAIETRCARDTGGLALLS